MYLWRSTGQLSTAPDFSLPRASRLCSIPAEAVIFDKNKNFVVVYKNAKDVQTREIQIAQTTNDKSFVFSGLENGEKVMLKNQLMIYNALNN